MDGPADMDGPAGSGPPGQRTWARFSPGGSCGVRGRPGREEVAERALERDYGDHDYPQHGGVHGSPEGLLGRVTCGAPRMTRKPLAGGVQELGHPQAPGVDIGRGDQHLDGGQHGDESGEEFRPVSAMRAGRPDGSTTGICHSPHNTPSRSAAGSQPNPGRIRGQANPVQPISSQNPATIPAAVPKTKNCRMNWDETSSDSPPSTVSRSQSEPQARAINAHNQMICSQPAGQSAQPPTARIRRSVAAEGSARYHWGALGVANEAHALPAHPQLGN
jgi:hypothetical protein